MLHMILSTPWQTHNRVTFTCVSSWKPACWEGVGRFSTLKCVFLQFLFNSHWANTSVCAERAAAPLAAKSFNGACCWRHRCLLVWYYHLPAVLNFIWIGMKRSGRRCSLADVYLKPRLFFFSFHILISDAKWLDIVFYTSIPQCAFWDLTFFGKGRETTAFPQGYACRGQKTSISHTLHVGSLLIWQGLSNWSRIEWDEAFCRREAHCWSGILVVSMLKDAFMKKISGCDELQGLEFWFKFVFIKFQVFLYLMCIIRLISVPTWPFTLLHLASCMA